METEKVAELSDELINTFIEALAFYANIETYFAIGFFPDHPCGDFINDFEETDLGYKPGKRAREALRKYLDEIRSKNQQT